MLFGFAISYENLQNSIVAFILFSILASSIYVFNDLLDIHEDRNHPKKKFRPLASGAVSTSTAKFLIVIMSLVSLGLSLFFDKLFFILLFYFILNILYTLKLKHIAIVDISIIAVGFVLRIFAGSVVTNITPSHWIIHMTFLLALFLALDKRRDDVILARHGKQTRKNIDGYNYEFINASMVLMAGVIVVSYILYTVSSEVNSENLYLTSFFVILGIIRYMQITFVEESSGSPTKIVLKDRFLQLTILGWLISFFVIIKLT
ncbi:MAG: UbiA prenyltransferase family protein [Campylobacterales bacterium]|nr:UbiA prenyltransferase family protein [Campylobacterales bacterium]